MRAPIKRGKATGTRWTPPDRDWLVHQYLNLKKSALEISYEIGAGVGGDTVLGWLQGAGIPPRDLSQVLSLARMGSKNPNWQGGRSRRFGERSYRRAGHPKVCALCGSTEHIDLHHLDGDATNNALGNLEYRCHKCHMRGHHKEGVR